MADAPPRDYRREPRLGRLEGFVEDGFEDLGAGRAVLLDRLGGLLRDTFGDWAGALGRVSSRGDLAGRWVPRPDRIRARPVLVDLAGVYRRVTGVDPRARLHLDPLRDAVLPDT